MTQTALQIERFSQQAYRKSLAGHLMGVSLHVQVTIMQTLQVKCGHEALRINFEPYFSMAARGGARLSEIADNLAISRQAANQTANKIEAAGYLRRDTDASDGRARLLVLTEQGERVVADGVEQALRLERQMRQLAGSRAIDAAEASLLALCSELHLLPAYQREQEGGLIMAALLPPAANFFNKELMELTQSRGHPELKPNFGQVLSGIGPQGGRIHHIARAQNVSKQSISIIVARLEELGYLERVVDGLDARQQVLHLTQAGRQLIADAAASEAALCERMAGIIGNEPLAQLQDTMAQLHRGLRLQREVASEDTADIPALADDLWARLGSQGARALAQQLLEYADTAR